MRFYLPFFFVIPPLFLIIILLFSNQTTANNLQNESFNYQKSPRSLVKYAKYFDLFLIDENEKKYKLVLKNSLKNNSPKKIFYLKKEKGILAKNVISIPIGSCLPLSTTHIAIIHRLEQMDKITLIINPQYISSSNILAKIKKYKIKTIKNTGQLNLELLLQGTPKILFGSNLDEKVKNKLNILFANSLCLLEIKEYLEKTPLGRAEYIKLFALLFDQYDLGEAIFNSIEKNYLKIKKKVAGSKKEEIKVFF